MKVVLNDKEIVEAIREWCEKRFPVTKEVKMTWKSYHVAGDQYRLEWTLEGVEMPPKEGPFR